MAAWVKWYAEALDSVESLPVGGATDALREGSRGPRRVLRRSPSRNNAQWPREREEAEPERAPLPLTYSDGTLDPTPPGREGSHQTRTQQNHRRRFRHR